MAEKQELTLLQKVQAWLKSTERDYDAGMLLLAKCIKNRNLKMRLARKENPSKLEYELNKWVVTQTNIKALPTIKAQNPNPELDSENQDEDPENTDTDPEKTETPASDTESKSNDDEENANQAADDIVNQAKSEAEDIIQDAKDEAQQTQNEAEENAEEIIDEAQKTADEIIAKADDESRLKIIRGEKEIQYDELPERLKVLYDDNVKAYKKMRSYHEKLKLLKNGTVADRAAICSELVDLDALVIENWEVIDAWDGTPETPAAETTAAETITGKEINAARSYISRNKGRLAEGDVDREKYLPKVQERVTLLVTAELDLVVDGQRIGAAIAVDLHRVVDHQFGGGQRVDPLRIPAELLHGVTHVRQVDDRRHTGKILQYNT